MCSRKWSAINIFLILNLISGSHHQPATTTTTFIASLSKPIYN